LQFLPNAEPEDFSNWVICYPHHTLFHLSVKFIVLHEKRSLKVSLYVKLYYLNFILSFGF
jgi:hypothetical protein